jgi:ketosteroid isomerase-like protein
LKSKGGRAVQARFAHVWRMRDGKAVTLRHCEALWQDAVSQT